MPRDERTEIGGCDGAFHTTQWDDIRRAQTLDENRRRDAVGELLARYWRPVYCYLRRKGFDNEGAKDITQGFFHEVVLGRELIQRAESCRGRFRTFLLTALDRYVTSLHRADAARKRRPVGGIVPLEGADGVGLPEPARTARPDEAFHHAWAAALLDDVLSELERECVGTGKRKHWEVFRARILAPIVDSTAPVPLATLCDQHGIDNEMTASNMIVTVKRRFQAILRSRIRRLVNSDGEVEQELRELIAALSNPAA